MPFPGEGPFDRFFRSVFDDEDKIGDDMGGVRGWQHGHMMAQQPEVQVHQDGNEIQVDVDLPGVAAKDVQVQVWNPHQNYSSGGCLVQWSADRALRRSSRSGEDDTFQEEPNTIRRVANRMKLGPSVDCDHLVANLSRGVLTLKAPLKKELPNSNHVPRSIPISTNSL